MKLRQKIQKNDGVAMIVCITIISILVIFCFSLLLASYTFYASQNKNTQSDLNAEAAKTLSMALREELTESSEKSNLVKYLRYNVQQDSWPYYEPSTSGHEAEYAKRYFNLNVNGDTVLDGYPGMVSVSMYWMLPEPEEEEETPDADDINRTRLFIEVECKSGSQSYVVVSEYQLSVFNENSTYIAQSTKKSFNPANKTINTNEVWKWGFVGIQ